MPRPVRSLLAMAAGLCLIAPWPSASARPGKLGMRQVTLPDGTTTIDISTHNEADTIFTAACAYLS